MGLPLERIQEVGWSENTAVSCVTFDENLHPTVVFKNDSDHLPPELYSMKLRKLWPGMK